jgi:hypothetical protein
MSDFNEDLIKEINLLRTNPKKYAEILLKYVDYFKEKLFLLPKSNIGFQTEEGVDAFKEAVEFLNSQNELEPLKSCKWLSNIAKDYIMKYQETNSTEISDDDMQKIINKYGEFGGQFYRAMDIGGETPELTIIDLIVSDGDPSRKQREVLLSNEIKMIGVANIEEKSYGHCSSIITCTEFEGTLDKDNKKLLKQNRQIIIDEKENKIKIGEEKIKKLEVASVDKTEKILIEDGDKKKETKITKVMGDGSKQIAIIKEIFDD